MRDFGVHWRTVVPYVVGSLGAALFTRRALWAAALALPRPGSWCGRVRGAGGGFLRRPAFRVIVIRAVRGLGSAEKVK
jgi:hypothetical protein